MQNYNEPLLRVRDPDLVQSLRGRPRAPRNSKEEVPQAWGPQHEDFVPTPTPSDSEPGSSLSLSFFFLLLCENMILGTQLPRSSQRSTRRLNASVRRTHTQPEMAEIAAARRATAEPAAARRATVEPAAARQAIPQTVAARRATAELAAARQATAMYP